MCFCILSIEVCSSFNKEKEWNVELAVNIDNHRGTIKISLNMEIISVFSSLGNAEFLYQVESCCFLFEIPFQVTDSNNLACQSPLII